MKLVAFSPLLLTSWLVACAAPPPVDVRWNHNPEARVVLATYCCDSPITQELVRPYIPEAQLWGDGRLLWIEHQADGERQVFMRQLSASEMAASLQEMIAAGFFGWDEQYVGEPVVDSASKCLTVTLTDQTKTVCETHGGAPGAFDTLFDWLSQGAGANGTLYLPETAYLTGFRLEDTGVPLPEPEVAWPRTLSHIPVGDAISGLWIEGEDLLPLWEAANQNPYHMPVVEDNNDRYRVILQVPGVSWLEPDTTALDTGGRFDCAGVSEIPASECQALVALYSSTDGPNWADNTGWLVTNSPCTWSGIICTDGHVTHIDLLYNQLTGTLPHELGNLAHLRALGLWVNQLSGPIPAELGNLSELIFLDLSGNQISGGIPDELGDMTNLQTLSLIHNRLSGPLPAELGRLEKLETLNLSYNQFSGPIPAEWGDLANLNVLRLSRNQLSGTIPASLGSLNKLNELDLSYNQLRGSVPESFAQIARRSLWGNGLEGTVTSAGTMPIAVDYEKVHFTYDPTLATSVWPETIPATPVIEGEPLWYAGPEHVRFTFDNPHLPPGRFPMGINLAAEPQILVYPLAELAALDPSIQAQIETLQSLLADWDTEPQGDLPLLPVTNASQMFHAQVQYLVFGNIHGLRFVTQYAQESRPVNNQELFYTFQGLTNDGAYYVAVFFPVTASILPDTPRVADDNALNANFVAYLAETTAALDKLSPADFAPDLALLDAVVTSLRVERDVELSSGETALLSSETASSPPVAPPAGLVVTASLARTQPMAVARPVGLGPVLASADGQASCFIMMYNDVYID